MKHSMERVLQAATLLLPLACWPDLARPFSTPKIWLLACLAACSLAAVALSPRAAGKHEWVWLIWPAALATSALTAPFAGFDALLLAALPVPLAWALWRGDIDAIPVRRALLFGSAIESFIVCLQFAGLDILQAIGWHPESFTSARMRIYGTLGNPDFVAAWLCATLPLYLGTRGTLRVCAILQLAAIFATGSRAAILALPLGALAIWLVSGRPMHRGTAYAALATLTLSAAIANFAPARSLRETVEGRIYLARISARHVLDVPVAGFGPGSFEGKFAVWQASTTPSRFAALVDHAHNDYLEFWTEYGPVGLAAFLTISLWLARASRSASHWGVLVCLSAIALVDFPFHRPAEWALYWIMLGSLSNGEKGRNDQWQT
jgi:putative inorganic carbon (hco3(-)) transporter